MTIFLSLDRHKLNPLFSFRDRKIIPKKFWMKDFLDFLCLYLSPSEGSPGQSLPYPNFSALTPVSPGKAAFSD